METLGDFHDLFSGGVSPGPFSVIEPYEQPHAARVGEISELHTRLLPRTKQAIKN
jgi:hypothetical protein